MKPEMLQIEQYLRVHPVLKKDGTLQKKYIGLLYYFVSKQGRGTQWSKQMLKLYSDKIIGEEFQTDKEVAKDLNMLEKFKFSKYRFFLLTDCLFIRYFADKKQGYKIVNDMIEFYGKRYHKKLERLCEAFYSTGDESFTRDFSEMKDIFSIIWNNRVFMARPIKKIMITANMSAGKSTLLNALAGRKVNKTQNDTCTAKLHYLFNKAGDDGLNYELDHDLELDATLDVLMTDNDENDGTDIVVGTRFRSINDVDEHICFVDTPGVNSSMNKEHREMSGGAIESADCDILLYLFNGENIGSDDDIKHLKFVKDHYDGKIVFLVNRLDHYKKNVDSIKGTLKAVETDLKKIGFDNPVIYPISAYAGYLGKMALFGEELTEDEQEDLEFVKRKLKKEDFSYDKYYPEDVNVDCNDMELGNLLLHSGILSLEKILYSNIDTQMNVVCIK